jgi:hypothetical protein
MRRFWSSYYENGFGWFRIFGIGLHWKDIAHHRLLFSQRNGHKKSITLGNWRFEFLEKS